MMRRVLVLLLLCAAAWGSDRLAHHPPRWLYEDPIVHPFGRDSDAPADSVDAGVADGDRIEGEGAADRSVVTPDAPLAINEATAQQLTRLPRVGPKLAARIVARRDSLGSFRNAEDLESVPGIGPATRKMLEPLLRFR